MTADLLREHADWEYNFTLAEIARKQDEIFQKYNLDFASIDQTLKTAEETYGLKTEEISFLKQQLSDKYHITIEELDLALEQKQAAYELEAGQVALKKDAIVKMREYEAAEIDIAEQSAATALESKLGELGIVQKEAEFEYGETVETAEEKRAVEYKQAELKEVEIVEKKEHAAYEVEQAAEEGEKVKSTALQKRGLSGVSVGKGSALKTQQKLANDIEKYILRLQTSKETEIQIIEEELKLFEQISDFEYTQALEQAAQKKALTEEEIAIKQTEAQQTYDEEMTELALEEEKSKYKLDVESSQAELEKENLDTEYQLYLEKYGLTVSEAGEEYETAFYGYSQAEKESAIEYQNLLAQGLLSKDKYSLEYTSNVGDLLAMTEQAEYHKESAYEQADIYDLKAEWAEAYEGIPTMLSDLYNKQIDYDLFSNWLNTGIELYSFAATGNVASFGIMDKLKANWTQTKSFFDRGGLKLNF